jgi:hypothetical protein
VCGVATYYGDGLGAALLDSPPVDGHSKMADGWTTIESEPAVFHQLIREIGCDGVQASSRKIPDDLALLPHVHLILPEQVEEIWSLDESSLHDLE